MKYLRAYHLSCICLALTACGGSGGQVATMTPPPVIAAPVGPVVNVPKLSAFQTYATNDTGYNRVRADLSLPGEAGVLRQFEDANPASPAGYRSIIALNDRQYAGDVRIEAIARVSGGNSTGPATRLLRLTADQAPLERAPGTKGRYYLRGDNFAWVTIDDGPLLSGSDSRGLVNLVLDFDMGRADINLRTGVSGASVVRTEINVKNLPFDVRDGSFGGPIAVAVHDPDSSIIYNIRGQLRGNAGGTTAYANDRHGLSASGLYNATGRNKDAAIRVNGAFAGVDPNALP